MMHTVKMADQDEEVDPVSEQEAINKDDEEENGDDDEEDEEEEEEDDDEEEEEEMYGEIVQCWQMLPLDFVSGSSNQFEFNLHGGCFNLH